MFWLRNKKNNFQSWGLCMMHRVCLYLQGEKEKNIEDVHEFSLVVPTLEYHNQIWTWFDLLMAMKNDSKRVLISQVMMPK